MINDRRRPDTTGRRRFCAQGTESHERGWRTMDLNWLWVLAGIIIGAALLAWTQNRSEVLIRRWAARNGYRLVDFERRALFRGPFFLFTSQGQTVYRVTVQMPDGKTRNGYTRLGGWFTGLISDDVAVAWDD
jgi:hypothetical protein